MRITAIGISFLVLAACSPAVPDSRAAAVAPAASLPRAASVATAPLDGGANSPAALAAATAQALGVAPAGGVPMTAMAAGTATNPLPEGAPVAPAAISDEQSFAAVTARETPESDAARIAENREQYVVIQPTDLPPRPDGQGPSTVAFALATNNVPGQALYDRSSLFSSDSRFARNCAKYAGDDAAQQAFLDAGGPERDRYGIDPDGDGFACYWDPRPFRAARQGAPEIETEYQVIETPGQS
jgi:hypothetical protein